MFRSFYLPGCPGAKPSSLLMGKGMITTIESHSNSTNLLLQVSLSSGSWLSRNVNTVRRSVTWGIFGQYLGLLKKKKHFKQYWCRGKRIDPHSKRLMPYTDTEITHLGEGETQKVIGLISCLGDCDHPQCRLPL